MTFEQLEYFIATVENNTFFDAAESLHISQSTISKQLKNLETELGLKLFDRSGRSAVLTDAGKVFYQDAIDLHKQYRDALSHLNPYKNTDAHKLNIGTLPILPQYQITSVFYDFATKHPDIPFTLDEVEEVELMRGLEAKKYDFVIGRSHMFNEDTHLISPLTKDELMVIIPDKHPLAQNDSITLQELASEKMILMNPYTAIYQLCMQIFQQANISPNLLRTARVESILNAVSIGEGISLLPRNNLTIFRHDNIVAKPLNPAVSLAVVMARNKREKTSKKLLCLLDFLKNAF
ncbi:DNA-binding transcriptional LysR family regulator [Lachnospiraceae bacterium PM6-15]|uniref:LysR family transcriptional regulator n=1 Tax=Ohessyouella blattaphilus TaxID=2949333 RepID=UPI003E280FFE